MTSVAVEGTSELMHDFLIRPSILTADLEGGGSCVLVPAEAQS